MLVSEIRDLRQQDVDRRIFAEAQLRQAEIARNLAENARNIARRLRAA